MQKVFLYIFFSHTDSFTKILISFVIYTDFVLDTTAGKLMLLLLKTLINAFVEIKLLKFQMPGYYVDNPLNRRLGRVGMPHGSMVHSRSPNSR